MGQRFSPSVRHSSGRRPCLTGGGVVFPAILAILAVLAVGCQALGSPNRAASPLPSSVTIGFPEGGDNLEAFNQVWPIFVQESLTTLGSDGRAQPGVAAAWDQSPDGLTWRITLRDNVYFHDGTKCDAAAVKNLIEAFIKSDQAALYPGLSDVREVRADGEHTVVIELRQRLAFLVDNLYIEVTRPAANGDPAGVGPYFPVSKSDREIVLQAHSRYFQGKPAIDRLVFKAIPTLRLAWASLLRGEITAVSNLSGDALEFLRGEAINTYNFKRHYAYVMAFNSSRPQLRAPAVRRALNMAVDRKAVIDTVLKGRGRPAFGPVWPDHWAHDESASEYSFDPSLAKSMLDALVPGPAGTLATPSVRFTCLVPSDNAILERLGLVLQAQMNAIGVDLQFESVPQSEFRMRLNLGQFDAVLFDLAAGPSLSRAYLFWHSPGQWGGLNVFRYRNTEADKWLDRLRTAPDDTATRAATSQLQRVMLEDPPAVFLAWSERARAVSRTIDVGTAEGQDPFLTLWKWRQGTVQQQARR